MCRGQNHHDKNFVIPINATSPVVEFVKIDGLEAGSMTYEGVLDYPRPKNLKLGLCLDF